MEAALLKAQKEQARKLARLEADLLKKQEEQTKKLFRKKF